jgi:hypothetical protein
MNFPKDEQLRLWSRDLSLITAFVVCILSWLNGNDFSRIFFKAIITFLVIYGLTIGCLAIFRKTAYSEFNEEIAQQNHKGTLLDVSLEDDVSLNSVSNENETGLNPHAGQVDPAFISGDISHKQQADIIRRMGWKQE